jgi:hypothetical protein
MTLIMSLPSHKYEYYFLAWVLLTYTHSPSSHSHSAIEEIIVAQAFKNQKSLGVRFINEYYPSTDSLVALGTTETSLLSHQ